MKLASFLLDGRRHLGALTEQGLALLDVPADADLGTLLRAGADLAQLQALAAKARRYVDPAQVRFLPPAAEPPKPAPVPTPLPAARPPEQQALAAPPPPPALADDMLPAAGPDAPLVGPAPPVPPEAPKASREEVRFNRYDRNRDELISRIEMMGSRIIGGFTTACLDRSYSSAIGSPVAKSVPPNNTR